MLISPTPNNQTEAQGVTNTQIVQNRNNVTQATNLEEESKVMASAGSILRSIDNTPLVLRASENQGLNRYGSAQPADNSANNIVIENVNEHQTSL